MKPSQNLGLYCKTELDELRKIIDVWLAKKTHRVFRKSSIIVVATHILGANYQLYFLVRNYRLKFQ